MPKKLASALLLVLCFSLVFAGGLSAQTPKSPKKPVIDKPALKEQIRIPAVKEMIEAGEQKKATGQLSQEVNTKDALTQLMASGFLKLTFGEENAKGEISDGLIPTTSGLMADMYANPAANTQTYLADVFNSAGMLGAQPAYAQGFGFSALTPVLSAWKIFRNVAYFFFVVIFLIIGFMIMFRQKISGQAVVTAQQAIPTIIIALVTVTFSYAIAGLMIDLMYLFMYLLIGIFQKDPDKFIGMNFLELGWSIISTNTFSVGENVGQFVNDTLGGGLLSGLAGIASGITIALIFAVAIAIGMFRLFFNLLKRYVAVILSVAAAPIVLMMGAIPGKNTFTPWLKGLIGNLAAFPILLLALIVSDTITGNISRGTSVPGASGIDTVGGGFLPPYLGGGSTAGTLPFLVGLGILLVLSELVDKGAEALGAGKGPFDDLVGAAWKNLRRGDEAIPAVLGGYGLAQGAAAGGLAALKQPGTRNLRGIYKGMRYGTPETRDGVTRIVGGAVPRAQRQLERGRKIRKTLTDIEKGTFLQTDNISTAFDEIIKNQREAKPKADKGPAKGTPPI